MENQQKEKKGIEKKFNCEMTFTPNCNEMMKEILNFFEVEILQGEIRTLPDGRIQYFFNASEKKMAVIRKAHWLNDMKNNPQS